MTCGATTDGEDDVNPSLRAQQLTINSKGC